MPHPPAIQACVPHRDPADGDRCVDNPSHDSGVRIILSKSVYRSNNFVGDLEVTDGARELLSRGRDYTWWAV
jgi:hypothetical protein